jgi:hypothetical protein
MAKSHGRVAVFKLDSLAGALTDISTYLDNVTFQPSADRPETQTFGQGAKRRQVLGLRDGGTISVAGFFIPATAKLHGRTNKLLVDQFDLTSYFDQCNIKKSVDLSETQTFGDNWKERGVPGLFDGAMSLSGFFDSVANGPDARLKVALGDTDGQIVTRGCPDFAIGSLVDMLQAAETNYEEPANENEVNRLSAEFVPDGYIDLGVSLHDLTNVTSTGGFTAVDETAGTTLGGVGHLHVTSFGGSGSPTISIQHSTSGSTWANLLTFTALTAATAQRSELSATATVKRYLRANIDTAGAPGTGITFVAAFARRGYAYGTAGTYRHWCGMLQNANSQSFEYGPEGGSSGNKKLSGEARLGSLEVDFNENEVVKFSADLMADGAISTGTF